MKQFTTMKQVTTTKKVATMQPNTTTKQLTTMTKATTMQQSTTMVKQSTATIHESKTGSRAPKKNHKSGARTSAARTRQRKCGARTLRHLKRVTLTPAVYLRPIPLTSKCPCVSVGRSPDLDHGRVRRKKVGSSQPTERTLRESQLLPPITRAPSHTTRPSARA